MGYKEENHKQFFHKHVWVSRPCSFNEPATHARAKVFSESLQFYLLHNTKIIVKTAVGLSVPLENNPDEEILHAQLV